MSTASPTLLQKRKMSEADVQLKRVRFFSQAMMVLIPGVSEFLEAGIHGDEWYTPTELRCFRHRAEFEWRMWMEWKQVYAYSHAVATGQQEKEFQQPAISISPIEDATDAALESQKDPNKEEQIDFQACFRKNEEEPGLRACRADR